jgi:hypothetical protein
MTWYAASVIIAIRLRTGRQRKFPVWENVYLIEAATDEEALRKAERLGKAQEFEDKTMTLNGRPAILKFAGVRKLITIVNPFPGHPDSEPPTDGTEITYSLITVDSKKKLEDLISGQPVSVLYDE